MLYRFIVSAFFILSFIHAQNVLAAPTAQNISVSLSEDSPPRNITLRATNVSGTETVTYTILTNPAIGRVSLSGQIATYTPNTNANGTDTFTYQATGSRSGTSNTATVTINISAVNDVPVATSGISATTQEDTAVNIQLGGTDADGNSLRCYARSAMAGVFTVDANSCIGTFTPANHYIGTTTATYRVYDGTAYSANTTVTITVNATNVAPVASDVSTSVAEDNSVMIQLTGSDADNDALTYTAAQPTNGGVTFFDSDTAIYSPSANFNGTDSFTYQVNDGTTASNNATVSITVNAVNDSPTATNGSATTNDDMIITIALTGEDIDGDDLNYRLVSQPENGWVSEVHDGNLVDFTPAQPFYGETSFTFSVSDGARSANGTINVTVTAVPQAHTISATTLENQGITIFATETDADSSSLSFTISEAPQNGSVTSNGSKEFFYTPAVNYFGQDSFTYNVTDESGNSQTGNIVVNVMPDSGRSDALSQVGLNFITFSPTNVILADDYLDVLADLKTQVIRQIGGADTTWGVIEIANGSDLSDYGEAVRAELDEKNLQLVNTLFSYMFGSCTPPWLDYENPDEFVRAMDATCENYLAHAAQTILNAQGDTDGPIYVEIGNELFHWLRYESTHNYTPEEQAEILLYASDLIRATIPNALIVSPSVMFNDGASPEWKQRVETAIGSDWYDIENIHDYSEWTQIPSDQETFNAEFHTPGKLLYVTETCRSSSPDDTRTTDNTIEKKAAAIFQNLSMMWGGGAASVFWHGLNYSEASDSDMDGCGFLLDDLSYDAAGFTYRLLTTELIPFQQITNLSGDDVSQMLYEYRLDDGTLKYVAWGSAAITIPAGVSQMASVMPDAAGNFTWVAVTPGENLSLQDTPYLLK